MKFAIHTRVAYVKRVQRYKLFVYEGYVLCIYFYEIQRFRCFSFIFKW